VLSATRNVVNLCAGSRGIIVYTCLVFIDPIISAVEQARCPSFGRTNWGDVLSIKHCELKVLFFSVSAFTLVLLALMV
jgi:hypothetical protein